MLLAMEKLIIRLLFSTGLISKEGNGNNNYLNSYLKINDFRNVYFGNK